MKTTCIPVPEERLIICVGIKRANSTAGPIIISHTKFSSVSRRNVNEDSVVCAGKTCAADYAVSLLNAGLMAAPPLHLPNLFLINYESATERHKIARTRTSLIM